MPVDITIPSAGESITEVRLGPWHHATGEWVEKDQPVVEIETDKTTLEIPAPESGVLQVMAETGEDKKIGDLIGRIDPKAKKPADGQKREAAGAEKAEKAETAAPQAKPRTPERPAVSTAQAPADGQSGRATSVAKKMAADKGVSLTGMQGTGPSGRVTKADVMAATAPAARATPAAGSPPPPPKAAPGSRNARRERMSKIRARIAERLVDAQHSAAMLTTFNEADMSAVMELRKSHKEDFEKRHGVSLGFMSFFVKAAASALQAFPRVNAYIIPGSDEIEFHDFIDVSVAVGTDKGLVVPVLRNVEAMSFADIEQSIKDLATRARDGKLAVEEMTGGTFTISNGGVYGSLLSTPILNPPQSAILGMHKIMQRPIENPAKPGEIVLRPMMYLALSYDHRIIDGSEAVSFLVHIKQAIETPQRLLLGL
jgi:2-oxoglutarate dehydrogenase E2 component (dihydrolipoamide succinyltransferase)